MYRIVKQIKKKEKKVKQRKGAQVVCNGFFFFFFRAEICGMFCPVRSLTVHYPLKQAGIQDKKPLQ